MVIFYCSPESMGVVVASIFLIVMFIYIPVPFSRYLVNHSDFPHDEVSYQCINIPKDLKCNQYIFLNFFVARI